MYRSIRREQKRLIGRKSRYKAAWFGRRMAALARYIDALTAALLTARAIGDAFAYLFYGRDRNLIDEHLKHQRQPLLPSGDGGHGERLTLHFMQGLNKRLLLYHGLTTFLRLGDASLIDLRTARVAAIVELKTKQVTSTSTTVEMSFVAGSKEALPAIPTHEKTSEPLAPRLPPHMVAKRKRQMREIGEAFADAIEKEKERNVKLTSGFHFGELERAVRNAGIRDLEFVQAGPGFAIGALRLKRCWADKLLGKGKIPKTLGEKMIPAALALVKSEHPDSSLHVGSIGTSEDLAFRAQEMPFAWWPLDPAVLTAILFAEVIVITLHNPAHFWAGLRDRGFNLTDERRGHYRRASKRIAKNREMVLENFSYFENMTPNSLLTLESVLAMVDECVGNSMNMYEGGNMRVDFRPRVVW